MRNRLGKKSWVKEECKIIKIFAFSYFPCRCWFLIKSNKHRFVLPLLISLINQVRASHKRKHKGNDPKNSGKIKFLHLCYLKPEWSNFTFQTSGYYFVQYNLMNELCFLRRNLKKFSIDLGKGKLKLILIVQVKNKSLTFKSRKFCSHFSWFDFWTFHFSRPFSWISWWQLKAFSMITLLHSFALKLWIFSRVFAKC